jgi:hypothetical protein
VGIDAHCWLHRGCSKELAEGISTTGMFNLHKYATMLKKYGVTDIIVCLMEFRCQQGHQKIRKDVNRRKLMLEQQLRRWK